MKRRYYPKRVNPKIMVAHFSEIFKTGILKKTTMRTFLLVILAVCVARTFRINEIASRLPICVRTEKSKQNVCCVFLRVIFRLMG